MIQNFRHVTWLLAAVMVLISGCGGRSTGEVSGKVTFRDEPLAWGTIAFICQDQNVISGNVRNGSYHVVKVPIGLAKITVQAHPAPLPMGRPDEAKPAASSQPPKPFVPIPRRYQDADQSGLTFTVVAGQQTFDVTLGP